MLNWINLVSTGRARDMYVPWTEDEQQLLQELIKAKGIDRQAAAKAVREGCDSVDGYDKVMHIPAKSRKEMEAEAKEKGLNVDSDAPDVVLASHIEKAKGKKKPK